MFDPNEIPKMAKEFVSSLPPGFKGLESQLEQTLHTFLALIVDKMNLATREELDIQSKVLAKARLQIEALEQKLQLLEARVGLASR